MLEQFGDRLFRLRKENDLTIDEFTQEMNKRFPDSKLSKPMVSRYENNIHKPQRFSLVQEIAEFYGVTTDFLMCRTDDKYEKIANMDSYKRIPLLGSIAAGLPILAQENIEGYEYVPENMHVDFCLRVKGESMINSRILDGDIVYIRQQPDVENGEVAAVLVDGENATLKRVYKGTGTITLHAENPNFQDQVFTKRDRRQVSIIGKAIRFISEVR
ncbi:S24 family peptidase [Desulfosporosinus sp. OT]|uniref:helix-turn-helix domain-containing protein n=1 Tax=Desulfosporosinus sp. OT TaxID=913865 RepID=UPI0002239F8B|nr:S24 family peptidase [Desulfosporosinus sp. OT]EGW40690.1 lexA repressor [Desulfosporosinus sp. OT]